MSEPILSGLLQNAAILLALGMIYDYLWAGRRQSLSLGLQILTGILLGGIAVILMLTPWTLVPGLVFDTRSVMLSVSGLFFGPVPTILAMAISAVYRIFLGGEGMWMGMAVIVTAGTIGLCWRRLRPQWYRKRYLLELLLMAIVVHLVMLGCTVFLPSGVMWPTLKTIAFPVMIIYPLATLLLGMLMVKRYQLNLAREELARSEERWKYALEGAGDGVWDWNPSAGQIYYSSGWKRMLGYGDEEIGTSDDEWIQRLHPEDREVTLKKIDRLLSEEEPAYSSLHRMKCKDGSYKWILDRGKVMERDVNGGALRVIGTHTDLTAQKKTEEELIIARDKAQESDRLKNSFLNNISHEVRTPMNAIMGFASLLDEDFSEEEKKRFVRIINANASQLLSIIDDVLEISRLESERFTFDRHPFSIPELLEDILLTMRPEADLKGLEFLVQAGEIAPPEIVFGDRARVRQVLMCFISNALKYTPDGSIVLVAESVGDQVLFTVRDTGIGISPEDREMVFKRFFRTEEAMMMAVGGTGLGLSIASQIVSQMKGKIGVDPVEPHGSSFYMLFPLDEATSRSKQRREKETSTSLSNLTVLVAEDEDANYEYIYLILKEVVRQIHRARNGKEALDLVNTVHPDLILMDLKMPVMNGYEATLQLRNDYPFLPVIALTAFSQPEEKKLAADAGCTHFLSKPIHREKLLKTITKLVRQDS